MENVTKPEQIVFLFGLFLAFCAVAWWWLHSGNAEERTPVDFDPMGIVGDTWSALLHWRPVKSNANSVPVNMSSGESVSAPSIRPSLQTDGVQTPDQTADPAARRQKLLDTYRPLRKLGMSRDDARVFLHTLGLPLDNNLWAEAAPPDPSYVTPIVGRQTAAQFDPDYPYRPLEA